MGKNNGNSILQTLTNVKRNQRFQVPQACTTCRRMHLRCSMDRPCHRCVQKGLESTCSDIPRKKPVKNARPYPAALHLQHHINSGSLGDDASSSSSSSVEHVSLNGAGAPTASAPTAHVPGNIAQLIQQLLVMQKLGFDSAQQQQIAAAILSAASPSSQLTNTSLVNSTGPSGMFNSFSSDPNMPSQKNVADPMPLGPSAPSSLFKYSFSMNPGESGLPAEFLNAMNQTLSSGASGVSSGAPLSALPSLFPVSSSSNSLQPSTASTQFAPLAPLAPFSSGLGLAGHPSFSGSSFSLFFANSGSTAEGKPQRKDSDAGAPLTDALASEGLVRQAASSSSASPLGSGNSSPNIQLNSLSLQSPRNGELPGSHRTGHFHPNTSSSPMALTSSSISAASKKKIDLATFFAGNQKLQQLFEEVIGNQDVQQNIVGSD